MAVEYREYSPPVDLQGVVACLWERMSAGGQQLIVPDGCVDLIWLAERELVIAGPDTGPRTVWLPAGSRSSGLRLRPGAAGGFLGRPASEVRNCQVNAEDVFGQEAARLAERLAAASTTDRLRLLAHVVRWRQVTPDPVVTAAACWLGRPDARIATVAAGLGISERQLHRRTLAAVGYAPKVLARVLRLCRLTRGPGSTLVERALEAGYASQAHMSDEVRALTGLSPSRYLVRFMEDPPPADLQHGRHACRRSCR
ncbi:AraC family transcriptional regulator [Candidatus Protofrankia californiensis]|uniref:AraC family transcriptional regulator n=1 Tax=Candidatus Protofrankia californiensis TaxID=1839754 RepID=UPI001041ADF0|nr:helix-turn-helix domain-containing protein [Candidatus Protofrankia californiensis]